MKWSTKSRLREKASSTRRAYHSDFNLFESWCAEKRVTALPAEPETVAAFLAFEANRGIRPGYATKRCYCLVSPERFVVRSSLPWT
jgi:hypothetical protein